MAETPLDIRIADALDRAHSVSETAKRDWLKSLSIFGVKHQATLGCLLAIVREVWGPSVSIVFVLDGNGWAMMTAGGALGVDQLKSGNGTIYHRTEAEALVAALEAAP